MVTTLILAAALASQCVHHKHHNSKGLPVLALDQCSAVLPYPQWQPRDNEDTLSSMTPVELAPVTRYVPITLTEPCHVYSATTSGWGWWTEITSGVMTSAPSIGLGRVRAPEIDPAGALTALTMLAAGIAVIRGGKQK